MPITGPASYIPTCQAFIEHWDTCNGALPPTEPLVCQGGMLCSQFSDIFDVLVTQRGTVDNHITDVDLAWAELDIAKAAALALLNDFNEKVRAVLPDTAYARVLPEVPTLSDGEEVFMIPMRAAMRLWTRINTATIPNFTPPLILKNGVTLANFSTAANLVPAKYRIVRDAEVDLDVDREVRNDIQDDIYAILKSYRLTVPTRFPKDDSHVTSMPALSPEGGAAALPPTASGSWDVAQGKGKIDFTPAVQPNVRRFELRWSPGNVYHTDDESTLAFVEPGGPTSFLTLQGLGDPGAKSYFRVVAVLHNGHEAGSAPVEITRPV